MFWIVQSNLFREENYQQMLEALTRLGVEHKVVKVLPFVHALEPEVTPPEGAQVFVCGSTKLMRMAQTRGWQPGSFMNENMRYEAWDAALGDELLNHGAVVTTLGAVEFPEPGEWFIRPCEDGKAFTGKAFYKSEFDRWRAHTFETEDVRIDPVTFERTRHGAGARPHTPVALSPFKRILREYRFFVVDQKLVTASLYKMGSKAVTNATVDPDVTVYAQRMVDLWQPSRAFVIDIAMTGSGLKVLEYNCINCSGFYACDTAKIVDAIESMRFP